MSVIRTTAWPHDGSGGTRTAEVRHDPGRPLLKCRMLAPLSELGVSAWSEVEAPAVRHVHRVLANVASRHVHRTPAPRDPGVVMAELNFKGLARTGWFVAMRASVRREVR
jgi:hypothetical protein